MHPDTLRIIGETRPDDGLRREANFHCGRLDGALGAVAEGIFPALTPTGENDLSESLIDARNFLRSLADGEPAGVPTAEEESFAFPDDDDSRHYVNLFGFPHDLLDPGA